MNTPAIADSNLPASVHRSRLRRRVRWSIALVALIVLPTATIRELQLYYNPMGIGVTFRVKPLGPVRFLYSRHLGSLTLSLTHGQCMSDPEATSVHLFVGRYNRIAITDVDRPGFMLDEHMSVGVREPARLPYSKRELAPSSTPSTTVGPSMSP